MRQSVAAPVGSNPNRRPIKKPRKQYLLKDRNLSALVTKVGSIRVIMGQCYHFLLQCGKPG